MRTTLDIPKDLLNEAQRLLEFKSKTDTVIFSLRSPSGHRTVSGRKRAGDRKQKGPGSRCRAIAPTVLNLPQNLPREVLLASVSGERMGSTRHCRR